MSKVSIIIPIYNVEKYLKQCLDSLVNQTLADVEIICVNDGSTDSCAEIIEEYVKKAPAVKAIHKENGGYGDSVNRGLDAASGEYIGIVEPNYYAEPDTLEKLYNCAKENALDVCKSGIFCYSASEEKSIPAHVASHVMCERIFCPADDFKSLREQIEFFDIQSASRAAIYKNDFIRKNNIAFSEAARASVGDVGFSFKVWALAKRVKLVGECLFRCEENSEGSSVSSESDSFCICGEYREIESFLNCHAELKARLDVVKNAKKYNDYIRNYDGLSEEKALEFLKAASEEFSRDMLSGMCFETAYARYKWNNLSLIIEDYEQYHKIRQAEKNGEEYIPPRPPKESVFKRGWRCLCENGFGYTVKRLFAKLKGE